jgi:predicted 3-demethylubiquinone-9 3-methyltransferase (glyoxalase superfamily)
MTKIVPNIWFDRNADEAVNFYLTVFPNSSITRIDKYTSIGKEIHGFEAGDTLCVNFVLCGQPFMAINGGPFLKLNPSISFMVRSASPEDSRLLWDKLSPDGEVMMDFGEYPFSSHYGWLNDKYGLSWQIITQPETSPRIVPSLMFTQDKSGQAQAAIDYWTSIFPNSATKSLQKSPDGASLTLGSFTLAGHDFLAMDGGTCHQFTFSGGLSLMIELETQEEIDFFWEKLSAVPERANCGWLQDKFGVSWQVVPRAMDEMLSTGNEAQLREVSRAYMKMKKFELAVLQSVFDANK